MQSGAGKASATACLLAQRLLQLERARQPAGAQRWHRHGLCLLRPLLTMLRRGVRAVQLAGEEELTEMLGALERKEQALEAELALLDASGVTGTLAGARAALPLRMRAAHSGCFTGALCACPQLLLAGQWVGVEGSLRAWSWPAPGWLAHLLYFF
jgi:hypothetical protein